MQDRRFSGRRRGGGGSSEAGEGEGVGGKSTGGESKDNGDAPLPSSMGADPLVYAIEVGYCRCHHRLVGEEEDGRGPQAIVWLATAGHHAPLPTFHHRTRRRKRWLQIHELPMGRRW
uniref:Uncharacterized protein n=1 Tax=Oryza barthii TaxID=65489 RepID=A0A0D3GGE4_9ORYZ